MRFTLLVLATTLLSSSAFAECKLEVARANIEAYVKHRYSASNKIYMGSVTEVYDASTLLRFEAAVALVDNTGDYNDNNGLDTGPADIGRIVADAQFCVPKTITTSAGLLR